MQCLLCRFFKYVRMNTAELFWIISYLSVGEKISLIFVRLFHYSVIYSGTSDKGHSEKGTTSQQRMQFWTPFPQQQFIFNLKEEDNLSTEDKMAGPEVSFIRRFHCITLIFLVCARDPLLQNNSSEYQLIVTWYAKRDQLQATYKFCGKVVNQC